MRTKYKPWAEPYINEHPSVMLDLEQIKTVKPPLLIEIGSGKGKFLTEMALKNKDLNFIGVERNVTCSGITAKKLVEQEISNAKLMYVDADKLLDALDNNTVKTIFLNFSDPWPKKRHQKRRLTSPHFLEKYLKVLTDDGQIIFKTDNHDLYLYSLETFSNQKGLQVIYNNDNYDGLDEFDAMTEYELSFREKGQPIYKIKVKKDEAI